MTDRDLRNVTDPTPERLAELFEQHRPHVLAVAYRMLGSTGEAEDAVQEAWVRLSRTDISGVDNLRGWLTTVVARVCLDMLVEMDLLADPDRLSRLDLSDIVR
jgi:RNA polymerase sigma factor (sigma-70 family)